jgi:hypothetical protein
MLSKIIRHLSRSAVASAWEACEQTFIHDARAHEYEKMGNHEQAKWQREQAENIRLSYGQSATQW